MNNTKKEQTMKLVKQQSNQVYDGNKMLPKISIVTPSYNQAAYIERTIKSIIDQDYPNTEHIIIDGGSTDGTQDILKQYSSHLTHWVSEKDDGQTHAINKGLRIATGDLLAYQNSDDIYLPGAFKSVADACKSHPDCGIFSGDVKIIDANNMDIDEIRLIKPRRFLQVFSGPQIHNQAAFWTRETQNKIGLFDESYTFDMDYEYFSRILFAGIKCHHIRRHLGGFRVHAQTKTTSLQHISKMEMNRVFEKYSKRLGVFHSLPRPAARMASTGYKALAHLFRGEVGYLVRKRVGVK